MLAGMPSRRVSARGRSSSNNFLPCTGDLAYVRFPADGICVETGVESGFGRHAH